MLAHGLESSRKAYPADIFFIYSALGYNSSILLNILRQRDEEILWLLISNLEISSKDDTDTHFIYINFFKISGLCLENEF